MSAMNNERYLTDENTRLRAENHRLRTIIEACDVEQARLKARIRELEAQLSPPASPSLLDDFMEQLAKQPDAVTGDVELTQEFVDAMMRSDDD